MCVCLTCFLIWLIVFSGVVRQWITIHHVPYSLHTATHTHIHGVVLWCDRSPGNNRSVSQYASCPYIEFLSNLVNWLAKIHWRMWNFMDGNIIFGRSAVPHAHRYSTTHSSIFDFIIHGTYLYFVLVLHFSAYCFYFSVEYRGYRASPYTWCGTVVFGTYTKIPEIRELYISGDRSIVSDVKCSVYCFIYHLNSFIVGGLFGDAMYVQILSLINHHVWVDIVIVLQPWNSWTLINFAVIFCASRVCLARLHVDLVTKMWHCIAAVQGDGLAELSQQENKKSLWSRRDFLRLNLRLCMQ